MKTTIKILTTLSVIILCAACTKEEEPQIPLKKGINVVKTTPVTKAMDADSSSVSKPGHVLFPPVYGEE